MEFIVMNYSAGADRNDIYGRCDDSGMKNESFSKISEKTCIGIIMNLGNYVGNVNIYQ